MDLSLRYLFSEIKKHVPDAQLTVRPNTRLRFMREGMFVPSSDNPADLLLFDMPRLDGALRTCTADEPFGQDESRRLEDDAPDASGITLVTSGEHAQDYPACTVISVPDNVDMRALYRCMSTVFIRYERWMDSILKAVSRNAGLQEILDLTVPMLPDNPLYIADSSFKMLAHTETDMERMSFIWKYQMDHGYLPYQVMQNLVDTGEKELLESRRAAMRIKTKSFNTPFLSKSIRNDAGEHVGFFFAIELYRSIDEGDLEVADCLGNVLSTALYRNESYLKVSEFYHAHFMEDIIKGTLTDRQLISDQLHPLSWNIDGRYTLLLLETAEDEEAIKHHIMANLASAMGARCLVYEKNVLAVFNELDADCRRSTTRLRQLTCDYHRRGIVSDLFLHFDDLGRYYRQVRNVLDHADASFEKGQLLEYGQCFPRQAARIVNDEIPVYAPVTELRAYDEAHESELCRTLYVWLKCERNAAMAARELFVHRNTLSNRLDRIARVIDVDTDAYEVRLRLLMSLPDCRS